MSAVPGDDSFIWRDHAGLCYSQTSQNIQRILDIVLREVGFVCLQQEEREGEGYVRVLKFQPLCVCIPLVSKQAETYLMGICSQFVFCLLSP